MRANCFVTPEALKLEWLTPAFKGETLTADVN